MEKVHLRQDVSLGNEAAITSPEHFDCVLFSSFRIMWNDSKSGTTQGKLSLKLSKLSLLHSFVFSYYKYAFLNLFLSLLMLLLAHWHIKRLAKFLFSPAQKAPVPLTASCWSISSTPDTQRSNTFSDASELVHCEPADACECSFHGPRRTGKAAPRAQWAQVGTTLLCKSSQQGWLNPKAGTCLNGGGLSWNFHPSQAGNCRQTE